jgi:septin family protein
MFFKKTFTTLANKLDDSDMHQLVERVLKPYVTKEQLRQTILSNTLQNTKRMAVNERLIITNMSKFNEQLIDTERRIMSTITSRSNTEFWKFGGLLGAGCLALLGLGHQAKYELRQDLQKLEQKFDQKFDKLEQKFDQKIDKLDQKLDKLLEARQK